MVRLLMLRFLSASCLAWPTVGMHAAFVLPPASPAGAMLPVAAALLDAGHNVSMFAFDELAAKYRPLLPGARVIGIGPLDRPTPPMDKILPLPYEVLSFALTLLISGFDLLVGLTLAEASLPKLKELKPDVLLVCNIIPSGYALGESLDIPVVGLGFAAPWIFTTSLDVPWSLQPHLGSFYNYEELLSSPLHVVHNLVIRMLFYVTRNTLGLIGSNVVRWRLGVKRFVFSQHDPLIENPQVVPSLPELAAGYPTYITSNVVWAGMYDHPSLGGASLGKSEQADEIMAWLDIHKAKKQPVLYCAFGSEVVLDLDWAQRLVSAFGTVPVLWSLKKTPKGFETPPPNIFVTAWTPQKAVLQHPAVAAFFSHGGGNSVRESLAAGVPLIIMPFFGDQPTNAMIHADLGVAIKMHKLRFDSESFAAAFREISMDKYQQRAAEIKALNDKHVSLARAVEVVENAASGRFPMKAIQARFEVAWVPVLLFIALTRGFLYLACGCCGCCCRCCCRCARRPGKSHEKLE